MLTREQIEEIQTEHLVKGVSIKTLLKERGISASQYFWWKRKYSKPDVPEGFLPLSGGGLPTTLPERLFAASSRRESEWESREFESGKVVQKKKVTVFQRITFERAENETRTPASRSFALYVVPSHSIRYDGSPEKVGCEFW